MLEEPLINCMTMDQEFLQKVLREAEEDPCLEVLSVESTPGCNIGDNYMSSVTRVTVIGRSVLRRTFKRVVLMKRQPANIARKQAFRCDPAFRNEATTYRSVIPALRKFSRCRLPFPKCLHASSQFIVLEDLHTVGFKMADRVKGLDFKHAKLALQELGKYHAISLAMKHEENKWFLGIRNSVNELVFVPESIPVYGASLENSLRMALMGLEVYRQDGETAIQEAVHKMMVLKGSVFQRMMYLVCPKEPLSVICHGDFYINNMLFRYNERKEPCEVMFVDLQVTRYASLATDIVHLLCSSLEPGVFSLHHEELVQAYQEALSERLTTLAPTAPQVTLSDIQEEIENRALYGLIMGFLILPAVTAQPGQKVNLDKVNSVESFSSREFHENATGILSPRYFQRLHDLVLDFVDRGYI